MRIMLVLVVGLLAACTNANQPPPSKSFLVFFAENDAALRPEANEVIDRVVAEARSSAATGVRIIGFASPAGTTAYNVRLSEQRAEAVEKALLSRGLSRDLLVRTSQGATPIVFSGLEGQRVEVVVVGGKR